MNPIQPDPFRFPSHSPLNQPLPSLPSQSLPHCCHQLPLQAIEASPSSPVQIIISMLRSLIQMVSSFGTPQPLEGGSLAVMPQLRTTAPLTTSDPKAPSSAPPSDAPKTSTGNTVWGGVKDIAASVLGAVGGGYVAKGAGALLGTFGKAIGGFLKKIF